MGADIHELLLLLGRPAAGKSEVIDYLQHLDPAERRRRFRIGELAVLDDFPMLWAWLEEDSILERMGERRLHTTADGYFSAPRLWEVLIKRLCLEYDKLVRDKAGSADGMTVVVEFSRGSEHGGYRAALGQLSDVVLSRAAALYLCVTFEESLRKNRRRFNPARPDSILEHSLPDEKLRRLYGRDDWEELVDRASSGHLPVRGCRIPFVTLENEDDVTTQGGAALGARLQECLQRLWDLRRG